MLSLFQHKCWLTDIRRMIHISLGYSRIIISFHRQIWAPLQLHSTQHTFALAYPVYAGEGAPVSSNFEAPKYTTDRWPVREDWVSIGPMNIAFMINLEPKWSPLKRWYESPLWSVSRSPHNSADLKKLIKLSVCHWPSRRDGGGCSTCRRYEIGCHFSYSIW